MGGGGQGTGERVIEHLGRGLECSTLRSPDAAIGSGSPPSDSAGRTPENRRVSARGTEGGSYRKAQILLHCFFMQEHNPARDITLLDGHDVSMCRQTPGIVVMGGEVGLRWCRGKVCLPLSRNNIDSPSGQNLAGTSGPLW